jgi:hypothetical protein
VNVGLDVSRSTIYPRVSMSRKHLATEDDHGGNICKDRKCYSLVAKGR